jgi:predicted ATPase
LIDAGKPLATASGQLPRLAPLGSPKYLVVTGGPGAGKTALLEMVRRHFPAHVAVLPEAASILFGGGFPRMRSPLGRKAAQRAIYHIQIELERLIDEDVRLVLCDRGTLDGLAYWPGAEEGFLDEIGTTRERELERYSAVLHLRTPSVKNGFNHQNRLRIENAREAHEIDQRIEAAWRGHPRRWFVESMPDFTEKMTRALGLIRGELETAGSGHTTSTWETESPTSG